MPPTRVWTAAALLVGLLIGAVLLRLAWVGDDAYITLRTVENLAGGHGAVWNLGERVQTYTHPLWMMLLTVARLVTGECYYGTIAISYGLALVAVLLLMRRGGTWPAALAVGSLLLWSRSFTEYSVCGLENPLTFVLLALLANVAGRELPAARRTSRLALLVGLLATTRMDLALIGVPLLLANLRATGLLTWSWRCAAGLSPLLLWLLFAAVYYGTPLPVTAYAKAMSHGLPALAMAAQGLQHFVFMLLYDPLTLVVIAAGVTVGVLSRARGNRALAIGAALYLLYIVKVGGDFMAGRFFTVPFVVGLAILAPRLGAARPRASLAVALAAPALALLAGALSHGGLPAWLSLPADEREPTWHHAGVLDERSAYVRDLGLFSPARKIPVPGAATRGLRALGRTRPIVASAGKAGVYAFEGGELMHFFDPLLCDALLARLPASPVAEWRIGHVPREVPAGYLESLAFGDNRIHDPGLRRFYGALRAAISRPVLDGARWRAVAELWSGARTADLERFAQNAYLAPPRVEVAGADLDEIVRGTLPGVGPLWFDDERIRLVGRGGVAVRFAARADAGALAVQLAGEFRYRFRCVDGDTVTADVTVDLLGVSQLAGLVERRVELPARAAFDRVLVDTIDPEPHVVAALGSLRPR